MQYKRNVCVSCSNSGRPSNKQWPGGRDCEASAKIYSPDAWVEWGPWAKLSLSGQWEGSFTIAIFQTYTDCTPSSEGNSQHCDYCTGSKTHFGLISKDQHSDSSHMSQSSVFSSFLLSLLFFQVFFFMYMCMFVCVSVHVGAELTCSIFFNHSPPFVFWILFLYSFLLYWIYIFFIQNILKSVPPPNSSQILPTLPATQIHILSLSH